MAYPTNNPSIEDEQARYYERVTQARLTIQEAKRLEAELFEDRNLFQGATHAWDTDTYNTLKDALQQQETYYSSSDREHFKGKVIDPANLPDSPAMWAAMADQAVRRDEAHEARQQELANDSLAKLQAGDKLGSYIIDLERKTDKQQHVADVLSDCIAKEVAIRHDPDSDLVAEIRMDRDNALNNMETLRDRHVDAVRFQEAKPDHDKRQTAYKDLAAFAQEQGAGRAADFVAKYADWKVAQHDARVAEIGGNTREIAQTKERLAEVRAVAVKAKENVKTSEVAALNRAMAARLENPRAFTQYMERKAQETAKTEAATGAKVEGRVEQSPVQAERRGVSIWTRKENIATLRGAGFENTDAIRAAAKNTSWSDRAVQAKAAGFKDETSIFALSQHEKPFEKAMALKSQGMESQRQIAVVAMRDAPEAKKAPADDMASRIRAGNAEARGAMAQDKGEEKGEERGQGFGGMKRQTESQGEEKSMADTIRANNRAAELEQARPKEEALTR